MEEGKAVVVVVVVVVVVMPEPYLGREPTRTAADLGRRQRLKRLDVRVSAEHAVAEWHGDGAIAGVCWRLRSSTWRRTTW